MAKIERRRAIFFDLRPLPCLIGIKIPYTVYKALKDNTPIGYIIILDNIDIMVYNRQGRALLINLVSHHDLNGKE